MFPDFILAAIVGWCGTGWPIHLKIPNVPGGLEPGDWPPNCPMCGQIIGAISAVILVVVLGTNIQTAGIVGVAVVAFFGGSFGSNLIGSVRTLMAGR